MFLCTCLPTCSHSISWGNCGGIWIHKSCVELAKKLQIWHEVKHPQPDFSVLGPKKGLWREAGSPPHLALALGLWPRFSSQEKSQSRIKGRVRHQRCSYTDSAPWQPKNPLTLQEGVQTNPWFLTPPDFNPPRVICTQSTAENHFHQLPRVVGRGKQGTEQDKYLEILSDQTSALIKS